MTGTQDVMRVELERLTQYNRNLLAQLNETRRELATLREESDRTAKVAGYAVFLGRYADGSVDIYADRRRLRTRVAGGLEPGHLRRGETVLVDETYTIVANAGYGSTGRVLPLREVLPDARRAIVGYGDESCETVFLSEALTNGPLSPGDLLLVETDAPCAIERLDGSPLDRLLEAVPVVPLDTIVGMPEHLTRFRTHVVPLQRLETARRIVPAVLLHGPPGCGKSTLAAVLAHIVTGNDGRALRVHAADLQRAYVGETERLLAMIFDRLHELSAGGLPAVLVMEDIDALLRTRAPGTTDGVGAAMVPRSLALLDRATAWPGVVVIGTTSRPDLLDPAVLRPGRFAMKMHVGRPGRDAAGALLRSHMGSTADHDGQLIEQALELLFDVRNPLYLVHFADGRTAPVSFSSVVTTALLVAVAARVRSTVARSRAAGPSVPAFGAMELRRAVLAEMDDLRHFPQLFEPDDLAAAAGRPGCTIVRVTPAPEPSR